jgi:hypothetical protein
MNTLKKKCKRFLTSSEVKMRQIIIGLFVCVLLLSCAPVESSSEPSQVGNASDVGQGGTFAGESAPSLDALIDVTSGSLDANLGDPPPVGKDGEEYFSLSQSKPCDIYGQDPNLNDCEFINTSNKDIDFFKSCDDGNMIMLYQKENSIYYLVVYSKANSLTYRATINIDPSQSTQERQGSNEENQQDAGLSLDASLVLDAGLDLDASLVLDAALSLDAAVQQDAQLPSSDMTINMSTPSDYGIGHVICDRNDILLHLSKPSGMLDKTIDRIMHLRIPANLAEATLPVTIEYSFVQSPEATPTADQFNQSIRNFQSLIPCSTALDLEEGFFTYTPGRISTKIDQTTNLSLDRINFANLEGYDLASMINLRLNAQVIRYAQKLDQSEKKVILYTPSENDNIYNVQTEISLSSIVNDNQKVQMFASENYILYAVKENITNPRVINQEIEVIKSIWYSETQRDGKGTSSKITAISLPKPVLNITSTDYIFSMYKQFVIYEDTAYSDYDSTDGSIEKSFVKIYDLKNQVSINLKNTDEDDPTQHEGNFPFIEREDAETRIFIDEFNNSYYINVVSNSSSSKISKYEILGIVP